MSENDLHPLPEFHAVDQARLDVARDRSTVQKMLAAVRYSTTEITSRAGRLAERDRRNGYAEMFRALLQETR